MIGASLEMALVVVYVIYLGHSFIDAVVFVADVSPVRHRDASHRLELSARFGVLFQSLN